MTTTAADKLSIKDKYCILLKPDIKTCMRLQEMHTKLRNAPWCADYIGHLKGRGALPFHMTVIGGIALDPALSDDRISYVKKELKLFRPDAVTPQIEDITVIMLSNEAENRLYIGFDFKFQSKPYVLTGDHGDNEVLRSMLNADNFDLDRARHITLCALLKLSELKKKREILNGVKIELENILKDHKKHLMEMKLRPQIWKKPAGEKDWQQEDLTRNPYI